MRLGEICVINPKAPALDDDINVSFVPMPKVGENGEFDPSEIKKYHEVKKGFTYFRDGDILFAKITPCMENGKGAIARSMENGIGFGSTEFHVLRPENNVVIGEWVYYLLNWSPFRKEAEKNMTGSAGQKRVPKSFLENFEIALPDTETQKNQVKTLQTLDILISLRKQQLAKLDELVKARFVELFGAPETNPFKWSISKLSEFCDLQNGYAFKSQDYLDNSTVLNCRMSNIRPDGGFDAEYHPKYLPDTFWEKYKEYRLVDGDVIIAMTDMASDPKILGVPTIVCTNGKKFLLNQRVGKLTFYDNTTINNVYLMFVLSQKHIRQQLVKSAGGSTQINVGKPAVLAVEFFVPTMELQNQFATFVEQTDKSKSAIQQSLDKLETLKAALMQKYFG